MIRLHDSMTRAKREFTPRDPKNVRMYVCGPTVYDRAHIGNARPVVVFDVLFRLLRHVYGAEHVTYVRNVTDIEDKIIARAAENGEPIEALTARTYDWFQQDMAALGCLPPTHQPRATEHVAGMIAMIEALIANGAAYEAQGHVLFSVRDFPDYGRLSGRSVEDMIAGARVEVAPYKRDPMDFVLWKPSDASQPGWDSPWGRGRPGWHIECSAMSRALLGGDFDIHGGGADLMFPHHENEIAQSVCAHPGEGFAGLWMHNGMVLVEGKKMSKSLGNFFTVQDMLAEGAPGEVIRLALLMTHYREPLDLTTQRLEEARKLLDSLYRLIGDEAAGEGEVLEPLVFALANDLNTPSALKWLRVSASPEAIEGGVSRQEKRDLKASANMLGLLQCNATEWFRGAVLSNEDVASKLNILLSARTAARGMRDFARADAIRAALDAAGVIVMDRPGAPTEWELGPNFDPAKLDGIEA
jgi:cysteinyl-tRNA synthetase